MKNTTVNNIITFITSIHCTILTFINLPYLNEKKCRRRLSRERAYAKKSPLSFQTARWDRKAGATIQQLQQPQTDPIKTPRPPVPAAPPQPHANPAWSRSVTWPRPTVIHVPSIRHRPPSVVQCPLPASTLTPSNATRQTPNQRLSTTNRNSQLLILSSLI